MKSLTFEKFIAFLLNILSFNLSILISELFTAPFVTLYLAQNVYNFWGNPRKNFHVFSRFKSRVHLYAISSHRWTTITYHLHITADREFKELSVDLEWILYSKELKDDLLLINTASKKKQNIEYLFKRVLSSLQIAAIDFSMLFLAFSLSYWIWSSIFNTIKIIFLSFILNKQNLNTDFFCVHILCLPDVFRECLHRSIFKSMSNHFPSWIIYVIVII